MPRILIVDDDQPFAATLQTTLELEGHEAETVHTAAEAARLVRTDPEVFDLALVDLRLPDADGLQLLQELLAICPDLPAVILTAYGSVQTAVEAMRFGAFDFLLKPFPRERLLGTVDRAVERDRLVRENRALRRQVEAVEPGDPVGRSPRFLEVLELARRAAPTDATVLLLGETGTGKERLARYLHRRSRRADRALLTVNCAALADALLESQLFGHRRGAFTGAEETRKGLFEEADGGTLFLDEVGDVSAALQAKLLRVLQEGEFLPVGDTVPRRTDVRVIAATNRDLAAAVAAGSFREDLYYRLHVVTLTLPPLRDRPEDIPAMVEEFVAESARRTGRTVKGLTPGALDACLDYPWPGNVRELKNVVERAVILAPGEWIDAPSLGLATPGPGPAEPLAEDRPLWQVERDHIFRVLESRGWDKTASARVLGIGRTTLHRKIREYGIRPGRPPR